MDQSDFRSAAPRGNPSAQQRQTTFAPKIGSQATSRLYGCC